VFISRLLRLIGTAFMVIALCIPSLTALAANPAPVNFALRPGGKATIKVFAFCLDHAKKFPDHAEVRPAGLGDQQVRQALAYIVSKDYDQTNFKQAAFAIWYLRDKQWYNAQGQDIALAQDIVKNSANTAAPGAGQGMSLVDAQANGTVDAVTRDFTPVSSSVDPTNNYFGVGTLEIVNKSNSNQQFYLPFGTTFPAPGPDFQSLLVYGTQILSAQGPAQAANAGDISPLALLALLCTAGIVFLVAGYALRSRPVS